MSEMRTNFDGRRKDVLQSIEVTIDKLTKKVRGQNLGILLPWSLFAILMQLGFNRNFWLSLSTQKLF